jgi:hypothetical protein
MLGMLSNPIVTLMWLLEQVDVHALGSTPRASDSRIVISLILNSAVVVGMYFVNYIGSGFGNSIILGVILSLILSHNVIFGIGIVRPH